MASRSRPRHAKCVARTQKRTLALRRPARRRIMSVWWEATPVYIKSTFAFPVFRHRWHPARSPKIYCSKFR